ncbi:GAP family protein [Mycolicibacterium vaccae]|uniref:GAP family protein n=1 Tax=Mycolicibacterium vaccae TaxID=1810 RepID=UPI003CEF5BA4
MWSAVVLLALVSTVDPVRVGITAMLISRPRPMANLLVYWLGLMTVGIGIALVALLVLPEYILPVSQALSSAASHPVVPPIQIAFGILALPAAVVLGARAWTPQPTPVPVGAPDPPGALLPPGPGKASRLSWPALLGGKWGNSLGIAFAAGLFSATPPLEYCLVLLAIVASGAAIGTQISAVAVFAVIAFAIAEIPLLSYLVAPARTRHVVMKMHTWVSVFRMRIIAIALGVFALMMLAHGTMAI